MGSVDGLKSVRKNSLEELKRLIAARFPIIWVETWEEDRLETQLKKIAQQGFKTPLEFWSWSQTQGLHRTDQVEKRDLVATLQTFMESPQATLLFVKNFGWSLAEEALLKRALRDVYHTKKASTKVVFLNAPFAEVPSDLIKEIFITDFSLPDEDEIQQILDGVIKSFPNVKVELSEEQKMKLVLGALGLTSQEARLIYQKMLVGRTVLDEKSLEMVFQDKARIIQRDGLLELVPVKYSLEDLGGLENLKAWLQDRSTFFSKEARAAGIRMPKGLLMTGVSGCGKSLASQAIAAAWDLPLYRLDMNRVYGGVLGNPEECFRKAIFQIESVAPAILWLEEIEKGVAGYEQGDKGVTARIFSSFLTWLQEHDSPVFVAATANEINRLPPELLRKGRFDQIFFVDLPGETERAAIFKVHLQKKNADLSQFNLTELAKATNGFNGAEIEQCVANGLVTAFKDGVRALSQDDLFRAVGQIVPLSTTMAEQIKEIKRWADTRAIKASR